MPRLDGQPGVAAKLVPMRTQSKNSSGSMRDELVSIQRFSSPETNLKEEDDKLDESSDCYDGTVQFPAFPSAVLAGMKEQQDGLCESFRVFSHTLREIHEKIGRMDRILSETGVTALGRSDLTLGKSMGGARSEDDAALASFPSGLSTSEAPWKEGSAKPVLGALPSGRLLDSSVSLSGGASSSQRMGEMVQSRVGSTGDGVATSASVHWEVSSESPRLQLGANADPTPRAYIGDSTPVASTRRRSRGAGAPNGVGSCATDDLQAIIKGTDSALQVLRNVGTGFQSTQQVGRQQRWSGYRWKKVDVRSGRRNSLTGVKTIMGDKPDKPFTQRRFFGIVCGLIIVVDAFLIALETDDTARNGEIAVHFEILGYIFSTWYLMELLMRIYNTRPCRKFFFGKESAWNWFDIFLISASVLDMVFQQVDSVRLRVVAVGRVLRALRLFRVIRVLRIIRFMTFMREFHKLVLCLASSIQTLMCAMSLMTFVIFCFSVLFVQMVAAHLETGRDFVPSSSQEEDLQASFGSVGKSMISLYMAITAGRNWGELAELLLWVDPALRACFFAFLSLSIFGLTNVVTAVFVESAMQATQQYRDLRIQEMMLKERANVKHMKEIFRSIDADNSGAISLEEMQAYMSDESLQLQEYFEALELSASDTYTLFQLLDVDGSGEVDIDEFCDGCMRLGGNAKSFDMNCMWYEQRRTNRELLKFIQHCCMCLHGLCKNTQVSEKQTQDLLRAIEGSRRLLNTGFKRASQAASKGRRGSPIPAGAHGATSPVSPKSPTSAGQTIGQILTKSVPNLPWRQVSSGESSPRNSVGAAPPSAVTFVPSAVDETPQSPGRPVLATIPSNRSEPNTSTGGSPHDPPSGLAVIPQETAQASAPASGSVQAPAKGTPQVVADTSASSSGEKRGLGEVWGWL
mmetsp:Transcript_1068/g.2450  ORF Transcript_1068/g.2450 Transcript_1068/m.2450 type:complete len:914 (+) Transcript_1068:64-2805(+)